MTYQSTYGNQFLYYPFGMEMKTYQADSSGYRWGFNGQEKDDEVAGDGNSYTAEFWQYDARLGRRFNIDPMTAKYPWQSPYACFNNNPLQFSDPNGLEGTNETPKTESYTVKAGDNLSKIASANGTTPEAIMKANSGAGWGSKKRHGNQNWVFTGEQLKIPVKEQAIKKNTTYFSAGAGHDADQTGYIAETIEDMKTAGISNPKDVESHKGSTSDAMFATGYFSKYTYNNPVTMAVGSNAVCAVPDLPDRIKEAADKIYSNISENNVNGQINLIGYSTGSVIMAQTALYLAVEKNVKIDNLVLIGSAIDNNSQLMKALLSNPNIGKILRVDIPGDNVSTGILSTLSFQVQGNNHPHFKFAFWTDAQVHRLKLFKELKSKGIE